MRNLRSALLGEVLGTFIMVLFGSGAVATAVLVGALQGLWQVAVVWAIGVTIAIYVSAPLSGAHLNPAVTLAISLCRPMAFPKDRIVGYWVAQLAGAFVAGLVVWGCFASLLARFELTEGLTRGAPGSERAGMIFGQYFPNPAMFGTGPEAAALVSPIQAAVVEALGTALLVVVIFALTDPRNPRRLSSGLIPPTIGLTVGALIAVFAPLTQAGWNPARDFGPRLVALLAGYGSIALPGPQGGFWIYLLGPLVGGVLGGAVYELIGSSLPTKSPAAESTASHPAESPATRLIPLVKETIAMDLEQSNLDRAMAKEHPVVLFVCVHNAGRSQMAAAFTRELSQGGVEVRSAGSVPANEINPAVVLAMMELRIDLSQEYPKLIADEVVREADVVITMGCGDACPVYPGKKYEDWEIDDPAGQSIEKVRAIRDQIRERVSQLLAGLAPSV